MILSLSNKRTDADAGVAMVIVMVTIVVLGAMAASLSYSMKVEMTLARNNSLEPELEWLGRSGVEYAKWILAQDAVELGTMAPYDALNEVWAGGPGDFERNFDDSPLAGVSLRNNELGPGKFSITIEDAERRFNINTADEFLLERALTLMGVELSETSVVIDSILDWRDPDDLPGLSGAESDLYLTRDPPHYCKDGPIDDLSELLIIEGITPEMYFGPRLPMRYRTELPADAPFISFYPIGFVDLFTPIGEQAINVNTATFHTLQLIQGVDEPLAMSIIEQRAGPDGVDGTEDDLPFQSVMELPVPPDIAQALQSSATVMSMNFEVTVDCEIAGLRKRYVAMIRRNGPTDVRTLYMRASTIERQQQPEMPLVM